MSKNKGSFVLYTDSRNLIDLLSDEQSGKLLKAIFSYVEDGEAPELDEVSTVVFMAIKNYLDRDQAKYEAVCQKRAEYGRKGGEAKASKSYQKLAKASKSKQTIASVADSDSENDNDTDSDNESDSDINTLSKPKAKKHKYGTHENVLLSDEELEKLQEKFTDWKERIEELSEGLALKGYKYKSHYLAILKWAKNDKNAKKKGDELHVSGQRDGYQDFL